MNDLEFCQWVRLHPEATAGTGAVYQRLIEATDRLAVAAQEVEQLRAEVREWICAQCRIVYPGPPQKGACCVVCPRCGGDTMPRNRAELAAAQTEIKQLHEAIDNAVDDLNNESYQHGGFRLGIPDGVSLSWVRGVVENLATMTPRMAEQERAA
jgi:hypothetical protein